MNSNHFSEFSVEETSLSEMNEFLRSNGVSVSEEIVAATFGGGSEAELDEAALDYVAGSSSWISALISRLGRGKFSGGGGSHSF